MSKKSLAELAVVVTRRIVDTVLIGGRWGGW